MEWRMVVVFGVLAAAAAVLARRTSTRARPAPPAREW
jgi:hypothetical protein